MARFIIIICIVLIYLGLIMLSIFHVPMSMLLRMLPPFVLVGLLLRQTPTWVKVTVTVLLVIVGVYVLFDNDIMGPIEFSICDRPFDMPAQFYYSWRLYWLMAYLCDVSWIWGIPSCLIVLCYKGWRRHDT